MEANPKKLPLTAYSRWIIPSIGHLVKATTSDSIQRMFLYPLVDNLFINIQHIIEQLIGIVDRWFTPGKLEGPIVLITIYTNDCLDTLHKKVVQPQYFRGILVF